MDPRHQISFNQNVIVWKYDVEKWIEKWGDYYIRTLRKDLLSLLHSWRDLDLDIIIFSCDVKGEYYIGIPTGTNPRCRFQISSLLRSYPGLLSMQNVELKRYPLSPKFRLYRNTIYEYLGDQYLDLEYNPIPDISGLNVIGMDYIYC